MKKFILIVCLLFLLCGCTNTKEQGQIVATTLPVYEFTSILCEGTELSVTRLITENVSCLHDYSIQVSQMQSVESASAVIISGGGLEDFLDGVITDDDKIIDASSGIIMHHTDAHNHDHNHQEDPHYWLAPELAAEMANNIKNGLIAQYPQYKTIFEDNYNTLSDKFTDLQIYGETTLKNINNRNLITFHYGFSYFAESFDLNILKAIEEESGSEASAAELIDIIELMENNGINAIFTEENGSSSAASIIAKETGTKVYTLDMAISGNSYFDAMYQNINTIKGALG